MFIPEAARKLREMIDKSFDVVLAGHEHTPEQQVVIGNNDTSALYVDGGVLQDSDNGNNSSFCILVVDSEAKKTKFLQLGLHNSNRYAINRSRDVDFRQIYTERKSNLSIRSSFLDSLDDPGAAFSHPKVSNISLRDVFVYPDLQIEKIKGESKSGDFLPHADTRSYLLSTSHVILRASDKEGKTSIGKQITKDLYSEGVNPIFVNGKELAKVSSDELLKKHLAPFVTKHYGDDSHDSFWQESQSNGAIIVDDFHSIKGNPNHIRKVLKLLVDRFSRVFIITSSGQDRSILLPQKEEEECLLIFAHCRIKELGYAARETLITKWLSLGREVTDTEQDIEFKLREIERKLATVILKDVLPALPLYMLILLQKIEHGEEATTQNGSFGYLYETLITATLHKISSHVIDLDSTYNYLRDLAYHLYNNASESIGKLDLHDWHAEYCNKYRLQIDANSVLNQLEEVNVLEISGDNVRFRYPYLHFYFIARYLRDHISNSEQQEQVIFLSRNLHDDACAKIYIFLCHLSKESLIVDAVSNAANKCLTKYNEATSSDLKTGLHSEAIAIIEPEDELKDPQGTRRQIKQGRDQDSANIEDHNVSRVPDSKLDAKQQTNNSTEDRYAAQKIIQIIGQILRNFSGSLTGDQKKELLNQGFNLALRVLSKTIQDKNKIVDRLREKKEEADKKKDYEFSEALSGFLKVFDLMMHCVTVGLFTTTAESVGTEKASLSVKDIVQTHDNDLVELFDVAIQLEHYKAFPRSSISSTLKTFKDNKSVQEILRAIVWIHLCLYQVDYRDKQWVLSELKIKTSATSRLLNQDTKRISLKSKKGTKVANKKHS